jgi:glucose-6-phosphate 1-dehydrogenase
MSTTQAPPQSTTPADAARAARGPGGELLHPFRAGMRIPRRPGPCALVIFGATGDLTRRKLMPALFRLFLEQLLPEDFAIIGAARSELSDDDFRQEMRAAIEEFAGVPAPEAWKRFAAALSYVPLQGDAGDYADLAAALGAADRERGTGGNRLYYLAVPPQAILGVVEGLSGAGLVGAAEGEGWTRIVIEKPFGTDLESARSLNAALLEVFDERQIFRIDHYLGKETVQNLLVFRFANVIWEPIWNRHFVDHVQVTVAESVGIGTRAGYYERAGALRDMVQSHLLQLVSLVAIEPPASYDADAIRDEKVKVLSSIRPIAPAAVGRETVRAQYDAGTIAGAEVPGYCEEPGVAAESRTETYVALRLWIDNWRWAGVPFYLRTGKRLAERVTEISIHFRPAPHPILDPVECDAPAPNVLVMRIQPEEGISLGFEAKVPGIGGRLHPVAMDFSYQTAFTGTGPDAYERLLLDAMLGDATLFTRGDEAEAAWALMTPILEGWAAHAGRELPRYPAGSWGPAVANSLLSMPGQKWREVRRVKGEE